MKHRVKLLGASALALPLIAAASYGASASTDTT
ncbi:hypothetical protein BH24ACT5_BH24ACT5_31890 [soil metagenome]